MRTPARTLAPLIALLLPLTGCAFGPRVDSAARLVDLEAGVSVTAREAAVVLQDYDVVFLGEHHGNQAVHRTHLGLLQALGELRGDMALSMEMFERDEQVALSRYLAGELMEEELLAQIETWPRYERDYRPMVEFARERGMPVLAANAPRSLARRVGREGLAAVAEEKYLPAEMDLSRGEYFDNFCAAMGMADATEGEEAERVGRLYEAQRLWDCSMAETIAVHFAEEKAQLRRPLVVHVVGAFHVSGGMGTMQVLRDLRPDLRIALVDVTSVPGDQVAVHPVEPDGAARYLLVAPAPPPRNVDSAAVHGATANPHGKSEAGLEDVAEEAQGEEETAPASQPTSQPSSGPTSRPASSPSGGI